MSGLQLLLGPADWLSLFTHFATLSLLAVGGAITTAPDMHRFLVDRQHWLTDTQFNASIAIAQAAPGPNVLFVALMGWNVGLNAGGYATAVLGLLAAMLGILLPSTTLTYLSAQWGHRNRHLRSVRAFKQGMAPIVVALLVATGWVLAATHDVPARDWGLWVVTALATVVVWRTRLHLLWLLGAGALLGALGWV
ncbi:chromate transporter [Pseudorhodoferax sp. Leaf267]|uniref:chromate transporter n=1 Tax=Pseudorhodoferax sp. Leaf267 TaxID=1736316 RepID=UPI0006F79340|nr:chromate transporter [Pseudorhodoferax sp. Leaf267]KQP23041.1 chromate transporter [Pseudorhodoferax sp. Leaf267]